MPATAATRATTGNDPGARRGIGAPAMSVTASESSPARAAKWLRTQRTRAGAWIRLSIVLSLAAGLLLIAQAWALARTIDAVVFQEAGLAEVVRWLWVILACTLGRAVLGWLASQAAFNGAARVRQALRSQVMDHLHALGPGFLRGQRTGETVNAVSDGIEALEGYYARYLPAMSLTVLLPLAILVVVLPSDWIAGLVMLVTAPLIPLFMVLIGKGSERLNQRQWRRLARLSAHFLDVVQGLTTLKLFNASRREIATIARVSDDYRRGTMAVLRVAFLSSLTLEFFATVSIALVAVSIGFRLLWGEMAFVNGLFVLLLVPDFYLPLRNMGTHYHARMAAIGASEGLLDILDQRPPETPTGPVPPPDLRSSTIAFDGISVVYPGGVRALDGIDLSIEPGERIALVGPSGAGKSTLFQVLLGFVQPDHGQVRVGVATLAALSPDTWRRQLAWVPQRPYLVAGTVADNVRMGDRDADAEAVNRAIAQAGADFVFALPSGLDTPIGEGGEGLSGGQRQRIALARAFLRAAPLTLLDEPTAHLDPVSERDIQLPLERLAARTTLLVIAHRLHTVESADRIVLLRQGRIEAVGSHRQLASGSAGYRRLLADHGIAG